MQGEQGLPGGVGGEAAHGVGVDDPDTAQHPGQVPGPGQGLRGDDDVDLGPGLRGWRAGHVEDVATEGALVAVTGAPQPALPGHHRDEGVRAALGHGAGV